MNLVSVGISHLTAAVEIRERMWLSEEELRRAVTKIKEQFYPECMLVSTCNRTELYGIEGKVGVDAREVTEFLIEFKNAGDAVRTDHFQEWKSDEAVEHLFRVVSGIESQVVGDIQILNQVKEAFALARESHTLGPVMNRLMQTTLHVGKRTRSETGIGEGAVSVSYAAVELAGKIFADLSRKSSLLIGAGETGELTLKHLLGKGIGQVFIANRTREKAEALTRQFGGTVVDFENVADAIRNVDIVIASVNSPTYVVLPEHVHKVMKQRSNNPLLIIDIAVPRNVDPASKKIENVFLYDIDSLSGVVDRNVEERKSEIPKVESIVQEELQEFLRWVGSLEVGPAIQQFHDLLESIRHQEVEKNIHRFKPEDRELVDLVTRRILNKVLHTPATVLKQESEEGKEETMARVKALRDLFGFSDNGKDQHGD